MYVKGSLKLMQVRQVIARRLDNKTQTTSFFIECNGRILDWNTSISALSLRMAESDGFVYLFVGREDAF